MGSMQNINGVTVYRSEPNREPSRGTVIVIHEIWGLVDHIRDIADRFAALGWLAAAPDILSHGGIEPAVGIELFEAFSHPDEDVRVAAQPRLRDALTQARAPEYADWAVTALRQTTDWLGQQPGVDDRLAVTGFCFGGTYTFLLAASDDRIRAAAPFYGRAPGAERMAGIGCPIMAIYGQQDPPIIDTLPEVREQLATAGIDFDAVVYPDAAHAFFNDTGPNYREDDAADAWNRVTEFLRTQVS